MTQEPGSLFRCHALLSLQFIHVHSFSCRHRRSQGGVGGHVPHISRTYSHLCFEKWYHKQTCVIRLKSNILAPTKIFVPPKRLDWLRYCLQGQVAKVASGLFYCWSLSCNNNMAANLKVFTASYNIRRFVTCDS